VAEYRLTVRAHADVLSVYTFSEAKFGRYQAEAYHAGLERTFGLLADFPGIGIAADDSSPAIAASASSRTTFSTPRSRTTS
jgi:toxin ParE1/3/4